MAEGELWRPSDLGMVPGTQRNPAKPGNYAAVTLPIYIFQGTIDANVPVEQSREIAEAFQTAGKTNLHLLEFEMHDHDLNYILYPLSGTISEGLQAIFDTAKEL